MKHTKFFRRLAAGLLAVLMLLAAMPAAMAQPGPTPAPNRCTGNPDGSHYWGKWKTKREATCEKEGKKERKCRYCSQTEKKSIKKTDHKWGDWTVTVEATDRSMGTRKHTCTVCGKTATVDFYPEGTLKRGDKGDAVKALQSALNAKGYDCGNPDGSFGKKTESAVKAFEATIGLTGDGIAWPAVIAALVGSADTKTASVRMPDKTQEKITVGIFNKVDNRKFTTECVDAGKATNFDLPQTSANGQPLTWVVQAQKNSYGTYPEYKKGMSFDTDVFITGIAPEDALTITFTLNDTVVWELKVDKAVGFRLDPNDATYAIVDGKWVEWEAWLTRDGVIKRKPDEREFDWNVNFRGTVKGIVTTMVLEKDTVIGDYSDIKKNHVDVHAGDVITVLGRAASAYVVLKPGGQRIGKMNINAEGEPDLTFLYPNDDAPIYLDAAGGKVEREFLPAGTKKSDFPKPVRANYKFKEWKFTGGAGKTYAMYKAQWEPERRFTITIDYGDPNVRGGGVTKWGEFDNYCTDYSLPVWSFVKGYQFTGWQLVKYKAPGMSKAITCDRPFEAGEPLTGDITLYAKWKRAYYIIDFDMTVWKEQKSIWVAPDSTDYTLPTPEKKDGYEFTGWVITKYTYPDTNSVSVGRRSFTPGQKITGNITLQAQYKQTKWYTIHFDAGQGNTVKGTKYFFARHLTSKKTRPDGTLREEDIPSATPGDKNLNFEGWYTADGERVSTDTVFTKDTTVYASWSSNPTVSFIKNKK